jgi:hypothetical protein
MVSSLVYETFSSVFSNLAWKLFNRGKVSIKKNIFMKTPHTPKIEVFTFLDELEDVEHLLYILEKIMEQFCKKNVLFFFY